MNMNFIKIGLATLALTASTCSTAGSVEWRYLVWFNLSSDATVDARIRRYLNHDDDSARCWEPGSLLFMRDKPRSITPSLVANAVVHREKAAMRELDKILKRPYKEADTGFDGIMVYTDSPRPLLYSMALRPVKIRRAEVHYQNHPKYLEELFCDLAPLPSRPS